MSYSTWSKAKDLKPKEIANVIINKKADPTSISPLSLVSQITSSKQTVTVDTKELEKIISEVITENPKAVDDYKNGKEASLMFLFGQVMKKIGRKVETQIIKAVLIKALK